MVAKCNSSQKYSSTLCTCLLVFVQIYGHHPPVPIFSYYGKRSADAEPEAAPAPYRGRYGYGGYRGGRGRYGYYGKRSAEPEAAPQYYGYYTPYVGYYGYYG